MRIPGILQRIALCYLIVSTLPAIGTVLFGILVGHSLHRAKSKLHCVYGLLAAGVSATLLGLLWDHWFPINKMIWTSSYCLFCAGSATILFAVCYWLIDVRGYQSWTKPFLIFGMNAIAVYVLSGMTAKAMTLIRISGNTGASIDLKSYLFQNLFLPLASPIHASLLGACTYVLCWLGIMGIFYRHKIFLRI